MAKKRSTSSGIVYSTDPGFTPDIDNGSDVDTLPAAQQNLQVKRDAKQRAGKIVTLVQGFVGKASDLDELGRKLKSFCGTGGSVKENQVIIQGDNRDKITGWLQKQGYSRARSI